MCFKSGEILENSSNFYLLFLYDWSLNGDHTNMDTWECFSFLVGSRAFMPCNGVVTVLSGGLKKKTENDIKKKNQCRYIVRFIFQA